MKHIAFLGLGAMGSRMALHLVKAGHHVTVWNRDPAKAASLVDQGAVLADTPRAAAEGADLVFTMVTDDSAAHHVWLDAQDGAVAALKPGAIAIECSTTTPAWVTRLAQSVHARGAQLLDAPVAGSRPQADAAQLIFMVGGEAKAFEEAVSILNTMAAKVLHVGPVGHGAVLKLAVNALFAAQVHSVAELLGFLSHNGYAAERAAELLSQFPIVAPPIAGAAKMMAAKNAAPMFTIDLIEKDLGYVIDTARSRNYELQSAAGARSAFQRAQSFGLGNCNFSELAAVFA